MYQEIGKHLDAGLETDLILLDFAKAFDSVCHKKLLQKLKWFGICGPLLAWFESYLIAAASNELLLMVPTPTGIL